MYICKYIVHNIHKINLDNIMIITRYNIFTKMLINATERTQTKRHATNCPTSKQNANISLHYEHREHRTIPSFHFVSTKRIPLCDPAVIIRLSLCCS